MDRISEVWRGTCVLLAEEGKESKGMEVVHKVSTFQVTFHIDEVCEGLGT